MLIVNLLVFVGGANLGTIFITSLLNSLISRHQINLITLSILNSLTCCILKDTCDHKWYW